MTFNELPQKAQDSWYESAGRFRINYDSNHTMERRPRVAVGLAELTEFFNASVLKDRKHSIVTKDNVHTLSDEELNSAIVDHILGMAVISDETAMNEIDKRYGEYPVNVYMNQDIIITADKPLIIDSAASIVHYGTVIINAGGYIEIRVPCQFTCNRLQKVHSPGTTAPPAKYDILIAGKEKKPANSGKNGDDGRPGADRHNAWFSEDGGNGEHGSFGISGDHGNRGDDGPKVVIKIDDLASDITVLNRGGHGQDGGNGGNGGNGGRGGNGSDPYMAIWPKGSNGGNGGNGANGGDGGNGGNGGDGKDLIIITNNRSNVLFSNEKANGGKVGKGGERGVGGEGGRGYRGGKDGNKGQPGQSNGKDGTKGNDGRAGTTVINPPVR